MNPVSPTSEERTLSLRRMFAAATQEASNAMCRWTGGQITLSLQEVREVPLFEVALECGIADGQLNMVVLTLDGELGGSMILTFDEENGRELAATLLSRGVETSVEWTPLEISALNETGNILACAYLNALTRIVPCDLIPSPPLFVRDFGASVLEQALIQQAIDTDIATVGRTSFRCQGRSLEWNVLFVPTEKLRVELMKALRIADSVASAES